MIRLSVVKGTSIAIILGDDDGGTRVAGKKCGVANPIYEFDMEERDLVTLIDTAKEYLKVLRKK